MGVRMGWKPLSQIELDEDQARLVEENRGLSGLVAERFIRPGICWDDLVQAGFVGLCVAASKYDKSRGFAFGTYAVHWIRREMLEEIRRHRMIRLPVNRPKGPRGAEWDRAKGVEFQSLTPHYSWNHAGDGDPVDEREESPLPDPRIPVLKEAIRAMPRHYRDVVERRLAGETQAKIGCDLGVSKSAVQSIEARAHSFLRRRLDRASGSDWLEALD